MHRRGFLGLGIGAAAAGPAMMRQTADAAVGQIASAGAGRPIAGGALNMLGPQSTDSYLDDLRKQLATLAETRAERIRQARRFVQMLDPDLQANRSLSLSTKARIQAERNADAEIEHQRGWLGRQIADLMKGQ